MNGPLHMFIFINFIFTLFRLIFLAILFLQEFYKCDMITCSVYDVLSCSKVWISLKKRLLKVIHGVQSEIRFFFLSTNNNQYTR